MNMPRQNLVASHIDNARKMLASSKIGENLHIAFLETEDSTVPIVKVGRLQAQIIAAKIGPIKTAQFPLRQAEPQSSP